MTVTYIAADWDHDERAVNKLYEWNRSYKWDFNFQDAHELTQARDDSLACSIKTSLLKRIKDSEVFVLIVGSHTDTVTKGGCQLCSSYNSYNKYCAKGYSIDYRSFIKYECDRAVENGLKIVVLYHGLDVQKAKCSEKLRNRGNHLAMMYKGVDGQYYWDFQKIKEALGA